MKTIAKIWSKIAAISIVVVLIPMAAYSVPIQVGIGAFSGSETVIDFDSLAEDEIVTTQFLSSGVDFSSSSHVSGSTAAGGGSEGWFFFSNPGTAVLQNFIEICLDSPSFCQPVIIDFTTPHSLIGFDIITNPSTSTFDVQLVSAGSSTIFSISTSFPESFVGFQDPAGIDRIIITEPSIEGEGAIGIDDLRFEGVVPEPSTLLLVGSGLAGVIVFGRKRLFKKA